METQDYRDYIMETILWKPNYKDLIQRPYYIFDNI